MAKAAKNPPTDVVEVFDNMEQGSTDWYQARLGIPTASRFATILANGKDGGVSQTRDQYMRQLAGEIITGEPCETYSNSAMERGRAMEAEAREHYGRTRFSQIIQVGFVKRTVCNSFGTSFVTGCSPDSLVDADTVLEIKTMRPDLLIEVIERGPAGLPPAHRAQCQGSLWVTGRSTCHLMLFYRGMPARTFVIIRDEVYIKTLAEQVERFVYELHQRVARIRKAS